MVIPGIVDLIFMGWTVSLSPASTRSTPRLLVITSTEVVTLCADMYAVVSVVAEGRTSAYCAVICNLPSSK